MKRFWALQTRITRGVMIWQGERLLIDGFKWAPASLLAPLRPWREYPPFNPATVTKEGLRATYIGWIFTATSSLYSTFYIVHRASNTILNVYRAHDENDLSPWVNASPSKPKMYGVIVLSPIPDRRYTYGALLSVRKEQDNIVYADYLYQVNVERSRPDAAFEQARLSALSLLPPTSPVLT